MSSEKKESDETHEAPSSTLVATGGGSTNNPQTTATVLPLEWTQMGQCLPTNDNNDKPDDSIPPAQRILYPWDVMNFYPYTPTSSQYEPEETELYIVGTAGQKITQMSPELSSETRCNPNLTKLVFRSHLITKMEGLHGFKKLELLELYDNQIEVLEGLGGDDDDEDSDDNEFKAVPGGTLKVLDMSYNVIRDMRPVRLCPHLVELYLANNKLKSMAGLSQLKQLRKMDLGANRIRTMDVEELSGLVNLEELWLGKNKIESIQGLEKLTKLRRLDLQSNRLTSIQNLTTQTTTLEELYLSDNAIDNEGASHPTGLSLQFTELTMLDLSKNKLTQTHCLAHLTGLDELWLSGNAIASFEDVEPLHALEQLEGIYLEFNPLAGEFEYRKRLKELIPSLTQIDADMIRPMELSGGGGSGRVESMQVVMRRLQEQALARAQAQKEQEENGGGDADGQKR